MELAELLHLLCRMARAGDSCIIHRDISPKNILAVNEDGLEVVSLNQVSYFVLIDWGTSREVEEAIWDAGWVGTVPFMPRKMLEARVAGRRAEFNGNGVYDDLESLLLTLAYFAGGEQCVLLQPYMSFLRREKHETFLLEGRRRWEDRSLRAEFLMRHCGSAEVSEFLDKYYVFLAERTANLLEVLLASVREIRQSLVIM